MAFYRSGSAEGGFEGGIEAGLQRLLVSPEFLFRIESSPTQADVKDPTRVSDLELASRLSFFLWSSIPDDELLDVAAQGKLRDPGVLEAQVQRMLQDARVQRFVSNFGGQWLYLRNVPSLARNPAQDPDFDEGLRRAFRKETELFVEHLIREES